MIKTLLNEKYGDAVSIEYIDVDENPEVDNFPKIAKILEEKSAPLPIVAINNEPFIAGVVSYPHIVAELSKRGVNVIS